VISASTRWTLVDEPMARAGQIDLLAAMNVGTGQAASVTESREL